MYLVVPGNSGLPPIPLCSFCLVFRIDVQYIVIIHAHTHLFLVHPCKDESTLTYTW